MNNNDVKQLIYILIISLLGIIAFLWITKDDQQTKPSTESEEYEYQVKQEDSFEKWN